MGIRENLKERTDCVASPVGSRLGIGRAAAGSCWFCKEAGPSHGHGVFPAKRGEKKRPKADILLCAELSAKPAGSSTPAAEQAWVLRRRLKGVKRRGEEGSRGGIP